METETKASKAMDVIGEEMANREAQQASDMYHALVSIIGKDAALRVGWHANPCPVCKLRIGRRCKLTGMIEPGCVPFANPRK